jgi:ligand-binding sensor domain-containing protein/signal transduction histidine kinase
MSRYLAVQRSLDRSLRFPANGDACAVRRALFCWVAVGLIWGAASARGVVLWSDLGATLVHETGGGNDILGEALKRDDASSDTLYFKFHVNPLSDPSTEEYFAAFELYEGDTERLGVGNAAKAWAYSAFFNKGEVGESSKGLSEVDLNSSTPEVSAEKAFLKYELPRQGTERTIIFKVQYVAGGDDLVTVWLNPDLGPGANEVYQSESLTTRFNANASFDEIRLRHGGGGGGWTFSDMAIATSFSDFVDVSSTQLGKETPGPGGGALPFSFQSWQRGQGRPLSSLQALAQTRDGYLWTGGEDGLARFDGVRFVPFETWGQAHASPVSALLGDSQGRLWIGTADRGLTRYENGQFTTYTKQEGLPSESINVLCEDGEGQIWVGTDDGLVVGQPGGIGPFAAMEKFKGKRITALFKAPQGAMWVGASGTGIFEFKAGAFTRSEDASVEELLRDPHCLLVDRTGRVLVGAGGDSLLCRDQGQWRRFRIPRHTPRGYIRALAEEPDGTVWAGSGGEGLFQFKEGSLIGINAGRGLSDNLVQSLLVDREGNLWIGAELGLNRMRRKNLFVFGPEDGLGQGPVVGLAEVAPGVVWVAKRMDGLYRWQGRNFSRLTAAGLPARDPRVSALLAARDGSCWVACARGLLHFKDPQAVADESVLTGMSNRSVFSLAEDQEGRIWAGTREGELWRLWQGEWTRQTNLSETHAITSIVPGADGSMWIGTEGGGLYRFEGETRTRYFKGAGLSSDSIRALYLDGQKTLWIGTVDGGLSRWRDGHLATFTMSDGLPHNSVLQILEDNLGRLWLGGWDDITCVSGHDLDKLAVGEKPRLYPQIYVPAEERLVEERTGGPYAAGLKTMSGLLWFPALNGILVADPHHQITNAVAPAVVLEEILVDGVPAGRAKAPRTRNSGAGAGETEVETLRIPSGTHRFEVQYTGLGSEAPEQMQFRYRLEGLDSDWVEAGTRRMAYYNYVPPGHYRFHVTACDGHGAWSQAGASLALAVPRQFWQIWWINGLAALGLMFGIGGVIRLMEKKKIRLRLIRLEQERALERERTRIARDLHDEMGGRLCRISYLSEHARRDTSLPTEFRQQITSISDESREVLHSLDEIVWAVNPENDTLEHVASYIGQYAQEYFQRTGIECELNMPPELPPHPLSSHERHHLFLAIREAFANTLKHSNATQSGIAIVCGSAEFQIVASDNGVGFDVSVGESKIEDGTGGSSGNGLKNMRQRLAAIGGHCRVESAPGRGTIIRFVIPLNGKARKG